MVSSSQLFFNFLWQKSILVTTFHLISRQDIKDDNKHKEIKFQFKSMLFGINNIEVSSQAEIEK